MRQGHGSVDKRSLTVGYWGYSPRALSYSYSSRPPTISTTMQQDLQHLIYTHIMMYNFLLFSLITNDICLQKNSGFWEKNKDSMIPY